jgi:hypothetical protein
MNFDGIPQAIKVASIINMTQGCHVLVAIMEAMSITLNSGCVSGM